MRLTPTARRPAFTLVELLVVIALIIALAGIAVAVAESGAFGSQKVISAGDRASGWLLIARQRAIRDGAARGVRFFRSPQAVANPGDQAQAYRFTEAQYIEQPDPWVPNPAQEGNPFGPRIVFSYQWNPTATPPQYVVKEVYLVAFDPNGNSGTNNALAGSLLEYDQRVTAGDYLRLPEFGASIRITDTGSPPGPQPGANPWLVLNRADGSDVTVPPANFRRMYVDVSQLQQVLDLAAAHNVRRNNNDPQRGVLTTYKYAFQARPRPLIGEPILQLTGNSCIDFRDRNPGSAPNLNPYYPAANLGLTLAQNPPPTTFGVDVTPGSNWEYFDILFNPDGTVQNPQGGLICLWVRDPDKIGPSNNLQPHPRLQTQPALQTDSPAAFDQAGEQVLVTIYTRTGLIATHPVARPDGSPTTDPYRNAKDGINSGF
jgi:type II secretory pathway pseudopilin PulG